jgi:thymidylate kinase
MQLQRQVEIPVVRLQNEIMMSLTTPAAARTTTTATPAPPTTPATAEIDTSDPPPPYSASSTTEQDDSTGMKELINILQDTNEKLVFIDTCEEEDEITALTTTTATTTSTTTASSAGAEYGEPLSSSAPSTTNFLEDVQEATAAIQTLAASRIEVLMMDEERRLEHAGPLQQEDLEVPEEPQNITNGRLLIDDWTRSNVWLPPRNLFCTSDVARRPKLLVISIESIIEAGRSTLLFELQHNIRFKILKAQTEIFVEESSYLFDQGILDVWKRLDDDANGVGSKGLVARFLANPRGEARNLLTALTTMRNYYEEFWPQEGIVICNRSRWSLVAVFVRALLYEGRIDADYAEQVLHDVRAYAHTIWPSLYIFLDTDFEICRERLRVNYGAEHGVTNRFQYALAKALTCWDQNDPRVIRIEPCVRSMKKTVFDVIKHVERQWNMFCAQQELRQFRHAQHDLI